MTPFTSFVENKRDLKDTIVRPRISKMVRKPIIIWKKGGNVCQDITPVRIYQYSIGICIAPMLMPVILTELTVLKDGLIAAFILYFSKTINKQ